MQNSTITLHAPDDTYFTNYGVNGATATADFQPNQNDAVMKLQGPLTGGTEVEVVAEWPHGVVAGQAQPWQAQVDAAAAQQTQPGRIAPVLNLGFGGLGLLFAIGGPVLLYLWWYRQGRDHPVGMIADYLPEPPSDLAPGMVGTLIDESADLPGYPGHAPRPGAARCLGDPGSRR